MRVNSVASVATSGRVLSSISERRPVELRFLSMPPPFSGHSFLHSFVNRCGFLQPPTCPQGGNVVSATQGAPVDFVQSFATAHCDLACTTTRSAGRLVPHPRRPRDARKCSSAGRLAVHGRWYPAINQSCAPTIWLDLPDADCHPPVGEYLSAWCLAPTRDAANGPWNPATAMSGNLLWRSSGDDLAPHPFSRRQRLTLPDTVTCMIGLAHR